MEMLNNKTALENCITLIKNEIKEDFAFLLKKIEECLVNYEHLEERVNHLERDKIKSDVNISGVPFRNNECLPDIFDKVCNAIQVKFELGDINQLFRTARNSNANTTSANSSIIMRFSNVQCKMKFLNHYKKFGQLSLHHIGFTLQSRIYCNGGLTNKNAMLLRTVRAKQKENVIHKSFIRNGLVYVIPGVNEEPVLIKKFSDIDEMVAKVHTSNTNSTTSTVNSTQPTTINPASIVTRSKANTIIS